MNKVLRRSFLTASAFVAAGTRVIGANDRVRLGIIGTGNRGSYLMKRANQCQNIEWVAVCDAWDVRREKALELAGSGAQRYADYRSLLDRNDIDGVIVATWDNMHSRIAQDACRAGKDVYVEKPMTSQPQQGLPLVRAVREHKRVVQTGVQQRSMAHFREAKERFIDSGTIGEVHMVRTVWNANSGYLFKPPAGMEQKPSGLDWNACLGSLLKIPWDPKRYFNRFAYMDFGCGQTGGLFVHMVDVVQWYLGISKPSSVSALGGIYQYKDGRDTPDNINVIAEYPEEMTVTFEASITDMVQPENADIVFLGSGGRLHIFRSGYRFLPRDAKRSADAIAAKGVPDGHMQNWIDCIRNRKDPNATVEQGHWGALVCHMSNMAWMQKRNIEWDERWSL